MGLPGRPTLLGLQRLALRLRKKWLEWSGRSGQVYFPQRVAEYYELWRNAAGDLGGTFHSLADDLWEVKVGPVRTRIQNHQTELDSPAILALAGRKPVVHRLLASAGLPVPEHRTFSLETLGFAEAFLAAHPAGCVVKPANGHGGQGVTTHVQSAADLRAAAVLASLYDDELLIEVQVPGESYRLLVLEGAVVHAVARRGPRLLGDGRISVRGLIARENERRQRSNESPIELDRDCMFTVGYQGLSLEAVPAAGQTVLVQSVGDAARRGVEVRTVYNETVTHLLCESIRQDAETAARLVGSDFLGVDLILRDATVPLRLSGGTINEVNTTPALHHHYDRGRERYPEVALQVLRAALARKAPSEARLG